MKQAGPNKSLPSTRHVSSNPTAANARQALQFWGANSQAHAEAELVQSINQVILSMKGVQHRRHTPMKNSTAIIQAERQQREPSPANHHAAH